MEKQHRKRLLGFFLSTIFVAGISIGLASINPLERSQQQLSNLLYYERATENKIYIVAIENNTLKFQDWGRPSEWCRTYYIPVLQRLLSYQPKVIGMDILFNKQSKGICKDELDALIKSGNQGEISEFSGTKDHPTDLKLAEVFKKIPNLVLINNVFDLVENKVKNIEEIEVKETIQYPWKTFLESGVALGHNKLFPDLNSKAKYLPPVYTNKGSLLPAFSLQIVSKYLGLGEIKDHQLESDKLQLNYQNGRLRLPLENFWMLINFSKKPIQQIEKSFQDKSIVSIPFYQLYSGKIDPQINLADIKDKIVLMGLTREFDDSYSTPISTTTQMPGVMIHAQAIQTILDQAWLYNQSFPAQAATIAVLVLLSMLLIFKLPIGGAMPALATVFLAYTLAYSTLMFRQLGIIVNLVYPPLAIILASIIGYAYRYMTEFKQKTKATTALGQFVNSGVAAAVMDSDLQRVEKRGEKREITVIFTDIKGFTTISENLQPQSVVALLNEYLEVMSAVVMRNNGIVDKYEGDAIMAFFEEKEGLASHQVRAAQTALEMRAALPGLMEKWRGDPPLPGGEAKPEIDFRVGVSSGEAIVGTIGSSQHIQYTAIGDIVNLGSRLESANKHYQTHIMIAEATYEAIQAQFDCRFLDLITVKGKNKAIKIYELLGPAGSISADQAELIQAYNKGLACYFNGQFTEAFKIFNEDVLSKWPSDYLTKFYAERAQKCVLNPPPADWDFVYKMETK
jgi:adenylate cyclase